MNNFTIGWTSPPSRSWLGLLLFATAICAALPASAQPVLDQAYEVAATNAGPVTTPAGQSFTAGADGLLAEVWIVHNVSLASGTIEIRSGDGLSGPLLGGPIAFNATLGGDFAPDPVNFHWSVIDVSSLGVSVTSGQQYTVSFPSISNWYVHCAGGYAGGRYLDTGHSNCSPIAAPPGTGDLNFRTYVGSPVPPVPTAPQWALIALVLLLTLLGVQALRRRQSVA